MGINRILEKSHTKDTDISIREMPASPGPPEYIARPVISASSRMITLVIAIFLYAKGLFLKDLHRKKNNARLTAIIIMSKIIPN